MDDEEDYYKRYTLTGARTLPSPSTSPCSTPTTQSNCSSDFRSSGFLTTSDRRPSERNEILPLDANGIGNVSPRYPSAEGIDNRQEFQSFVLDHSEMQSPTSTDDDLQRDSDPAIQDFCTVPSSKDFASNALHPGLYYAPRLRGVDVTQSVHYSQYDMPSRSDIRSTSAAFLQVHDSEVGVEIGSSTFRGWSLVGL